MPKRSRAELSFERQQILHRIITMCVQMLSWNLSRLNKIDIRKLQKIDADFKNLEKIENRENPAS